MDDWQKLDREIEAEFEESKDLDLEGFARRIRDCIKDDRI